MRWVVAGRDEGRDALSTKESGHAASGADASCLTLTLAFDHLLYFAFLRTAGYVGCALGLGSGFLAGGPFQLLAFVFVGNFFCVHSTLIPAYFACLLYTSDAADDLLC